MLNTNLAWARFFRSLSAAANQLAVDLSEAAEVSTERVPESLPEVSPESLVLGVRQQQIASLPGLRDDEGMKTSDVARAAEMSDVTNVYQTLQNLVRRGVVEQIPNSRPQRWRLVSRFRHPGGNGQA
jgi:hypothetical protein